MQTLLKAKNITARQFAEEIGIQPSGMSHILSGRNNPSLDFVMKVVRRWPEVNISWLMFGKGEMYAGMPLNVPEAVSHEDGQVVTENDTAQYDLFSTQDETIKSAVSDTPSAYGVARPAQPVSSPKTVKAPEPLSAAATVAMPPQPSVPVHVAAETVSPQHAENVVETPKVASAPVQPTQNKKKVVKMIVLYDDHSFAEYYPE